MAYDSSELRVSAAMTEWRVDYSVVIIVYIKN